MKSRLFGLRRSKTSWKHAWLVFGCIVAFGLQLPVGRAGQSGQAALSLGSLSHEVMVMGLKEALTNGVKAAIGELGHEGGFLTNLAVRIPMPEKLQTVEKSLRALKQDQLADEFVAAMNHAAEKAVPAAATVFWEAISRMTIADAEGILTGPPDAVTQYFRRTTETNLFIRFLPIVKKATDATGVTASYKRVLDAAQANRYVGALLGALSDSQSMDIDAYVTHKAMGGLFKIVAEEHRIRQNPLGESSDLLRRVFGALQRK